MGLGQSSQLEPSSRGLVDAASPGASGTVLTTSCLGYPQRGEGSGSKVTLGGPGWKLGDRV